MRTFSSLICSSALVFCSKSATSDSLIVNKPIRFLWNMSASIVEASESTAHRNNGTCPREQTLSW